MGLRVFHVKHIEIILGLPHVAYRWCYIVSEVYEVFITASGLRRVHCVDPKLRTRQKPHRNKPRQGGDLAAGAIVSLRPALPFPPPLLPLPDHVHTPRNTSAISL